MKCGADCVCPCHRNEKHDHKRQPCPGKVVATKRDLSRINFEAVVQRVLAVTDCWVGGCKRTAKLAHNPCCSSHGRALCCEHYKYLHFVETGPAVCHPE